MRILVVGAGATGGYFGGRMAQAGRDVTFLVRPGRAAQIAADGLQIISPHGDVTLQPKLVTASDLTADYDAVLLTVKAYALDAAINDLKPAMAGGAMIMPVLNGMRHIDRLIAEYGDAAVLGGVCVVASMVDAAGRIVQLAPMQGLSYGERSGAITDRICALDETIQGCEFPGTLSETILQAMWEKWTFLATLGALTCLMRGSIGALVAVPGGRDVALGMLAECVSVATAEGFPPSEAFLTRIKAMVTLEGSPLTASMYRDLQAGAPVEADQILGDMLVRASGHGLATPLLQAAFTQLSIYQAELARSGA
jgi:2-dehydropantoate 2-reductase